MNIPSISTTSVATANSRPIAAQPLPGEARQSQSSLASGVSSRQTEQSVTQSQSAEATRQELETAVKQVNEFVKPINNSIQFNLDDDTGKTIVKVIDVTTQEVVRQIPSEEMISIAKAIDKMQGLLVQQKA